MTLSLFAQFAAVAALNLLATLITLTFVIASVQKRAFQRNTALAFAMNKENLNDLFGVNDPESFDDHVESTPGMHLV